MRVLLDAVVATQPRVSSRAMLFEAEFIEADGTPKRIQVIVPRSNHDLDDITRRSRVLLGGELRAAIRPYIVARRSTILWLSPEEQSERASPRVHDVEAHWRLLRSGKRIRVRSHKRGHNGVLRRLKNLHAVINDQTHQA